MTSRSLITTKGGARSEDEQVAALAPFPLSPEDRSLAPRTLSNNVQRRSCIGSVDTLLFQLIDTMTNHHDEHDHDYDTFFAPQCNVNNSTTTLSALSYIRSDIKSKHGSVDPTKSDNDTHSQTQSNATLSPSTSSAYSSIHSDTKESGARDDIEESLSTSAAIAMSSPRDSLSTKASNTSSAVFSLTPRNDCTNLIPTSTATDEIGEETKYRLARARSGTLGLKQSLAPATATDTENDASTVFSDAGDESAFFDYSEEPSEYIPPTTPKMGGFGVETSKVEPHKEGMRSAASERGNKAAELFVAERRCYSFETSDSWGANFWCVIEQPVSYGTIGKSQTLLTHLLSLG